jgi:hypothetical protein
LSFGLWLGAPLSPVFQRKNSRNNFPLHSHIAEGFSRPSLKCDGTRAETRFRLSAKRTSPFKSAGVSVQSTTGSRGVRISGSIVGYTMFRGSVKSTGYTLHSPVSPSLPLPCVTVCHHVSTGLYLLISWAPPASVLEGGNRCSASGGTMRPPRTAESKEQQSGLQNEYFK